MLHQMMPCNVDAIRLRWQFKCDILKSLDQTIVAH